MRTTIDGSLNEKQSAGGQDKTHGFAPPQRYTQTLTFNVNISSEVPRPTLTYGK